MTRHMDKQESVMACPKQRQGTETQQMLVEGLVFLTTGKVIWPLIKKSLKSCLEAVFGTKHELKLENFECIGVNFAVVSSDLYFLFFFQDRVSPV